MQAAKIIDVKRSFIPIDPNAFPENYHTTKSEDQPEDPAPIIPYMGANFLPTAYGYKSFFGTNYKAAISTLPAQAEHIFLFQNLAYSNTLVALCDTGIYLKDANTGGAWTQAVVMTAPGGSIYYEWFFETIKNKLYAFRGNGTAYFLIQTDIAQPTGVAVSSVIPSFITIGAQLGMFRLGGRLGFWDAENAIAWSSPDDLSDFIPSVLNGANVTTFISIIGKISAIRSHGKHAIVYASKSITLLNTQPTDTFLVKAEPIIGAGVPYNRQSVVGSPSTTHFCHSTTGIYRIENGKAEVIVPEVFDFFTRYTKQPIYLKLLNNRFLCFELLDENLANGIPHFSEIHYPEASLTFPGYSSVDTSQLEPEDIDFCQFMNQMNAGSFDEQQAMANAQIPDKKPGTTAEPIWVCYLSNHGAVDAANIVWSSVPCGNVAYDGTVWHMSPNIPNTSKYTTDKTNKTAKTGAESWTDGKWTMQRFFQTQSAIWEMEDKALSAVIGAVASRAFTKTKTENNILNCVVANPAYSYCAVGTFPSAFSGPKFGYNACSFWLTRYLLETKKIRTRSRTTAACDNGPSTVQAFPPSWYEVWNGGSKITGPHATDTAAAASVSSPPSVNYIPWYYGTGGGTVGSGDLIQTNGAAGLKRVEDGSMSPYELRVVYSNPNPVERYLSESGTVTNGLKDIVSKLEVNYSIRTTTSAAVNEVEETQTGVLGVETAFCEIAGWNYITNTGANGQVLAPFCADLTNKYPGSPPTATARVAPMDQEPLVEEDGSVCNLPFEAPLSPPGVVWEDQVVTYPSIDFLFQDGSIAPRWPTVYGFYSYDLHIKKWGKHEGQYKQLLDYLPINSDSSSPIATDNQGMLAGVLKVDGFIYLFDNAPTMSYLTWGKFGYYRKGMSDLQEVTFNFAALSSGSVKIDLSLDGKSLIEEAAYEESFSDVRQATVYPPRSGKWFNITVKGKFDISDLTTVGMVKGRR